MKVSFNYLGACLLAAACGGGDATSPDLGMPDAPAPSADLYAANCAGCHGSGGDGTDSGPQIRNPVHAFATYWIRTGRDDEMGFGQPMPSYSEAELPDLEPIFAWLDRPPHAADGLTLFTRYCSNCHGANAQGGRVGQDITHEAREGAGELLEDVRKGHGGAGYGKRTKFMPAWGAGDLSDADVSAIDAYLTTLPAAPGHGGGDDDDDDHDDD